jgi:DNA-binding response OmpR family regulator
MSDPALRILIVDPDSQAREGLGAILLAYGHRVGVARDLSAGFQHLAFGGFDVLILDADVPHRPSNLSRVLGLVGAARLAEPGARGILLSRHPDRLPDDLAPSGIVAILGKPLEFSRLRSVLEVTQRRILASRRETNGGDATSSQAL